MTQWYYTKNGPISEQQLKELVASGELQRTDLVWREEMWQGEGGEKVENIEGLDWPQPSESEQEDVPPTIAPEELSIDQLNRTPKRRDIMTQSPIDAETVKTPVWKKLWQEDTPIGQQTLVIVLCFLFCYTAPIGLILIGIHPKISLNTKKVVFGVTIGLFVMFCIFVILMGLIAPLLPDPPPTPPIQKEQKESPTPSFSETTSPQTTNASSGIKVSRGFMRGKLVVEVAPHLEGHVELSNLRIAPPFLIFHLKCDSATHVPRVFSCYNEDGVKLRDGELSLPSRFNTGERVEGKALIGWNYENDIALVKISSS